jgi:hypothetical protein
MKKIIPLSVLALLISCSPSAGGTKNAATAAQITLPPKWTETRTPTNTRTALKPTPTIEPSSEAGDFPAPSADGRPSGTATAYPTLSSDGPYLAYWVRAPANTSALTILDADGSGREIISLPGEANIEMLAHALSPDGRWLAFHAGSAGELVWGGYPPDYDFSGPLDLTLKLLHLPDGRIVTVSALLSEDYPDNFDRIVNDLIRNDNEYKGASFEDAKKYVVELFLTGIQGVDWSPDSRYLAFSGEMDGPSSDLYLYDTKDGSIDRLTDGPGEMTGEIHWSPDGKFIVHSSTNSPMGMQWTPRFYSARADNSGVTDLGGSMAGGNEWISPHTIVLSETANGIGAYDLRTVNVETGTESMVWKDSFLDYAFSKDDGSAALCANYGFYDESIKPGLYILRSGNPRTLLLPADQCGELTYRGTHAHRFVFSTPLGVYGVSRTDAVGVIRDAGGRISVSPNTQWMILSEENSAELFDKDDAFVGELQTQGTDFLIWRPDSQGFYSAAGGKLFYTIIPHGDPVLIDKNLELCFEGGGCYSDWDYRWVG